MDGGIHFAKEHQAEERQSCGCDGGTTPASVAAHITRAFMRPPQEKPYRHWLLRDVLPCGAAKAITALPLEVVPISETYGKRDSHNASRRFFGRDEQARYPVCAAVATALQDSHVVQFIAGVTGAKLDGSFLRIEYCQDTEGFWLEPHTDIGAKLFTMVIYLGEGPRSDDMGTDIYDGELRHVGRAPSPFNAAVVFVPADDTWHGFEKRPMPAVRRCLIVNYVKPEWRARQELAFPDQPVRLS